MSIKYTRGWSGTWFKEAGLRRRTALEVEAGLRRAREGREEWAGSRQDIKVCSSNNSLGDLSSISATST